MSLTDFFYICLGSRELSHYHSLIAMIILMRLAEYSLRESVSAQGREGRGFDSNPGRKKKAIFYLVIRKSR
jgi:hypothetical protein